jgi:hypothetical protein
MKSAPVFLNTSSNFSAVAFPSELRSGAALGAGSELAVVVLEQDVRCMICISAPPAALDRYLAALPAMSFIPFAPFRFPISD